MDIIIRDSISYMSLSDQLHLISTCKHFRNVISFALFICAKFNPDIVSKYQNMICINSKNAAFHFYIETIPPSLAAKIVHISAEVYPQERYELIPSNIMMHGINLINLKTLDLIYRAAGITRSRQCPIDNQCAIHLIALLWNTIKSLTHVNCYVETRFSIDELCLIKHKFASQKLIININIGKRGRFITANSYDSQNHYSCFDVSDKTIKRIQYLNTALNTTEWKPERNFIALNFMNTLIQTHMCFALRILAITASV